MPNKISSIGGSHAQRGVVDLRNKMPVDSSNVAPAKAISKKQAVASFVQARPRADYSRMQRKALKKNGGLLTFLIILLVLLVAAAIVSFLIFGASPAGQSLKMTLTAPKSAASGEEIALEITYENLDKISLEKMELVIQYPEGFYYNSSNIEPYNVEKNQWRLPSLLAGQSGQLSVKGQLMGKVEEDQEFTAVFYYQPANFSSDFKETISKKIRISDALLGVSLEVPEQIEDGQEINFKVEYVNNQPVVMDEVYFSFDLAEGFNPTYISPTTTSYTWLVSGIEPEKKSQLEIKGLAESALANPFSWSFRVWRLVGEEGDTKERVLYQDSGAIEIIAPQLVVTVEPNNLDEKFNWGEEIDLKIKYKNTGKLDIKEAVLKLALNNLIDWSRYNNLTGATRDNNILIWLSKSSPAAGGLAAIPVGGEGELAVSLPLVGEPDDLTELSAEELMIDAQAFMSVRFNGKDKIFSSQVFSEILSAEARLLAEARYYLDAQTQVGAGPLPPVIGQQTDYRIYWKVYTGAKGLKNIKIKTSLPAYINWLNQADKPTLGTDLLFDNSAREVVWEIAEAGPNSQLMASFNVSVIPSDSQVNQLLILTNPTFFTAAEKDTNNLVSKTADLLTSDLIGDPAAQGQGRVMVK